MDEQGGMDTGFRVISILVSGLAFYGGLGWLLDRWLQTKWLLPAGLILGMATGVYLVIARYGRST